MFGTKRKPVEVAAGGAAARQPLPRDQHGHFPKLIDLEKHPRKWEFPEYLDNPKSVWLQALKALYAEPIVFPASLSPEAGLMLHGLVRNLQPRVIVEIGVFCSISTHWMASALQESGRKPAAEPGAEHLVGPGGGAEIHCFDDFGPIHKGPWRDAEMLEGRLDFVKSRLSAAGLIDYCRFHPGDSSTNVKHEADNLRALGGIDLAFIDGDHTVPGLMADFKAVEPLLNVGGHVLLHDTFPEQCGHDGPRHLLDHYQQEAEGLYQVIDLYLSPLNYGMGLMRRLA
ncbi:MAG: class I SAM-dependent methyltransferase [Planctomycetota bacterium]